MTGKKLTKRSKNYKKFLIKIFKSCGHLTTKIFIGCISSGLELSNEPTHVTLSREEDQKIDGQK